MPAVTLSLVSSMATRAALAEWAAGALAQAGVVLELHALAGVEAARRIAAGEAAYDIVVLAQDALARLAEAGHVQASSQRPLMLSPMAVAVPAGAGQPGMEDEAALRAAMRAAPRIAYSTGPSGAHLLALVQRWGLQDELQGRLVQAPAGTPVAQLLAQGRADLAFQQLSELQGQPGVQVLGGLPAGAAHSTTFSAAVGARCADTAAAQAAMALFAGPACAALLRRHGMQRASTS